HSTKELQGDPRTRGESRTHKTPQVFLCDDSSHLTLLASISALRSGSLETGECHSQEHKQADGRSGRESAVECCERPPPPPPQFVLATSQLPGDPEGTFLALEAKCVKVSESVNLCLSGLLVKFGDI
ncbi:hypothetical protein U0070_000510, partial [Myodes glareolus]